MWWMFNAINIMEILNLIFKTLAKAQKHAILIHHNLSVNIMSNIVTRVTFIYLDAYSFTWLEWSQDTLPSEDFKVSISLSI